MKSNHLLSIFELNWASPVYLLCITSVFLRVIQILFRKNLIKWGFTLQKKEIDVDQDLPPFFQAVSLTESQKIVQEEINMRVNYGFSFVDTVSFRCL